MNEGGHTRDEYINAMAKLVSIIAGIPPHDPDDGSPNWWMFRNDVVPLVDSLIERNVLKVKPE